MDSDWISSFCKEVSPDRAYCSRRMCSISVSRVSVRKETLSAALLLAPASALDRPRDRIASPAAIRGMRISSMDTNSLVTMERGGLCMAIPSFPQVTRVSD